jgi:putative membrane protein
VTGEWRRTERRTIGYTTVFMAGVAVLAGVPTAFGLADGLSWPVALAWVLPGAAVVIACGVVAEWLHWRHTSYRVDAERVELRTGVLVRARRSLQRERIRTVDVTADPLARVFGLVTVRIGTGEHTDEGTVRLWGLAPGTGDELRRTLLTRAGTAPTADGELAALDPRWIRYAPLSFVTPVLGASAFGGVLNVADWFGLAGGVIGWAVDLLAGLPVLAAIGALTAGGLVVGVVGSLGLWVEMWRGYRLEREPGGTLRVRRGLLTTRSISLEEERLRGVDVVEPLGSRLSGAARVDAVATGMATGADKDKGQHRTLLPAAPKAVADRVAADVLREPLSPTEAVRLTGHPVAARGRRVRWALAAVVAVELPLLVLGALLTDVLLQLAAVVAVVGVPVAVALGLDAYRALGHGTVGGYLVTRSGSVRRSTVALQRRGIIGWTVSQSVFQRRAGLATVRATTAAGAGAYAIRDVGLGALTATSEQAAAQHGQRGGRAQLGVVGAEQRAEQREPVAHARGGEPAPRPVGLDERAAVALGPQPQQGAPLRRGQPPPQPQHRLRGVAAAGADLVEQGQLLGARARQQRLDQPLLGAEQEQQDPRAAADGLGQRPQRHPGQAVVQHVAVGQLQQLGAAGGRRLRVGRHSAILH